MTGLKMQAETGTFDERVEIIMLAHNGHNCASHALRTQINDDVCCSSLDLS